MGEKDASFNFYTTHETWKEAGFERSTWFITKVMCNVVADVWCEKMDENHGRVE